MRISTLANPAHYRHVPDLYRRLRRKTRTVQVGKIILGGSHPIRLQSMTTTDTLDTEATVRQAVRMIQAGCEIIRITTPTVKDAANLGPIRRELERLGYDVPLVADVHFKPAAAMEAAQWADKVRINPGNFVDGKRFAVREFSDAQYAEELERIEERFTPLVDTLKRLQRALRIGANHGSLSDRIMNRYGDSPLGMVESALEYVRICRKLDYHDIILSMKSSNPKVMIAAYRLLAARMNQEDMDYPFHLGVTEAGDGEDGRVKSAVGIGSLLEDGIGDTIRVSLTEDPELEIPVCRVLAAPYDRPADAGVSLDRDIPFSEDPFSYSRRKSESVRVGSFRLGGGHPVRVVTRWAQGEGDQRPEILEWRINSDESLAKFMERRKETPGLAHLIRLESDTLPLSRVLENADILYWSDDSPEFLEEAKKNALPLLVESGSVDIAIEREARCRKAGVACVVTLAPGASLHTFRELTARLREAGSQTPLLLSAAADGSPEELTLRSATLLGSLLCDGIGDAVRIVSAHAPHRDLRLGYNILQAAGVRITKTEYVSCPSCGRTLFDLQETTARIKSQTEHLKGLKIAIMGCIVNGPGEMADADFGYVGGAPGKINLYVGRECVKKGIAAEVAGQALIDLIKEHGRWTDLPTIT